MKALLFPKFKNICIKTMNTNCFTILYIGTIGEKAIQSCEYHKWGWRKLRSQHYSTVDKAFIDTRTLQNIYILRSREIYYFVKMI